MKKFSVSLLASLFFSGTLLADTKIELEHPGADKYYWYVDGQLHAQSTDKTFLEKGEWKYSPDAVHSFTAVRVDEDSEIESQPLTTKIAFPASPKIKSIKLIISLGQ